MSILTGVTGTVKDKFTLSILARMPQDDSASIRPYHHGALRTALLEAAERILERDGIQGLTLRAAAREAGASHAAPKNHFDDLSGLLSELAAVGFNRFAAAMAAAAANAPPNLEMAAIGRAYVTFATGNPGLFLLMFRSERLDKARPALAEAMRASMAALAAAAGAPRVPSGDPPGDPLGIAPAGVEGIARMTAGWSMVHGFAMLLLDGRLTPFLERLPPGMDAMALLDAVLRRGADGL
jgi:AcrR family transcriptional regulator